jgi:hypothetical protein
LGTFSTVGLRGAASTDHDLGVRGVYLCAAVAETFAVEAVASGNQANNTLSGSVMYRMDVRCGCDLSSFQAVLYGCTFSTFSQLTTRPE